MAIGPIITHGFGSFGNVNLIITHGFTSGEAAPQGDRFPDPSRSLIKVLADTPGTYLSRIRVLPDTPESSRIKQL